MPLRYFDPLGLWKWGDPLPQGMVDFSAAFGDTLSFGVTNWIREKMGTNGVVDKCSGFYSAGQWAGTALGFAMVGTGLVKAGLRVERGNWKHAGKWVKAKGKKKLHFHYGKGPGLKNHHLPYQARNWMKNAKSNLENGKAGSDIFNTSVATYGAGVAVNGTSKIICGCED